MPSITESGTEYLYWIELRPSTIRPDAPGAVGGRAWEIAEESVRCAPSQDRHWVAIRYDAGVPHRPSLAFACAHLTDERLYAAQVSALEADYECSVFAFRDHDSLGGMAEELLAKTPARFTLIGLSLGGYVAFEIIRRHLSTIEQPEIVNRVLRNWLRETEALVADAGLVAAQTK